MGSSEVSLEVLPYARVLKDGTIERLAGTQVVPAGLDPETGVLSHKPRDGVGILRDRGRLYHDELVKSNWAGSKEFVETEGEDHVFHIFNPNCEKAKTLIKHLASFINQSANSMEEEVETGKEVALRQNHLYFKK